jgi:hypothetical protein
MELSYGDFGEDQAIYAQDGMPRAKIANATISGECEPRQKVTASS